MKDASNKLQLVILLQIIFSVLIPVIFHLIWK